MRRYLVVAHQTLDSPELLATMQERLAEGQCEFHLIVPEYHGTGLTWTESQVRVQARRALEAARQRFTAEGLIVDGEVAEASPVEAVVAVVRRDGHDHYEGIIVSTLPQTISKWLRMDAPTRIQRLSGLPVIHVVAHPAHV